MGALARLAKRLVRKALARPSLRPLRRRVIDAMIRAEQDAPVRESVRWLLEVHDAVGAAIDERCIHWGKGVHVKHELMDGIHAFFCERVPAGSHVLDVGCGIGALAYAITTQAQAHVLGVDLDERNLEFARERFHHPNLRFELADVTRDLPIERVDVVVLSSVLEHIATRVELLKTLVDRFSPVLLLIRVPTLERHYFVALKRELGLFPYTDPGHVIEYSPRSFAEEMAEAGLDVRSLEIRWGRPLGRVRSPEGCRRSSASNRRRGLTVILKSLLNEAAEMKHRAGRIRYALRVARAANRIQRCSWQPGKPLRLAYAHADYPEAVPASDAVVGGGAVKYQYLDRCWPHSLRCHALYAVSSSHYVEMQALIRAAHSRGIPLVWNQDGTYVPFAHGPEHTRRGNEVMASLYHQTDYVFYQSAFARAGSERFLGRRQGPSEILYNAVDTAVFTPGSNRPGPGLCLLIAGSHESGYRLPTAINALALVARHHPGVRLVIAGRIASAERAEAAGLVTRLGLENRVEFLGPYPQRIAPEIFRQAHILVHTQYNDVCPSVVIEALACGLPVVYSQSGGTPELVGDDAGYAIPSVADWENAHPPDPHQLADGISRIAGSWPQYSSAARERAVARFDVLHWLRRHREVFEMLAERSR